MKIKKGGLTRPVKRAAQLTYFSLLLCLAPCLWMSACGQTTDTARGPVTSTAPTEQPSKMPATETPSSKSMRGAIETIPLPDLSLSPLPEVSASVKPTPSGPPKSYTFETPLLDSSGNRKNNLRVVARKLTGIVVRPGEEFSFNRKVGARTVKGGYRKATILVQGKKKKAVGGGICQMSTTLYNAALKAGFKITERHEHSKNVGYVDDGKDATVSYGTKDLKFINTTDTAFEILCEVKGDQIRVELRETEDVVEDEEELW